MSGHSKWATIHRQKEVTDAKRGQIFTKLASAIAIAVREGGGTADPNSNFKLRLAIEKARQLNMPNENIQRAIERGSGGAGAGKWEEVTYEGYGPGGVAVMVEATTDNKQRTSQVIKTTFDRGGGSLAGPGAVAFQFEKKGFLTLVKPANVDEATLQIIDMGVEDVEEGIDVMEVYTKPEEVDLVKRKLEKAGFEVLSFEQIMKPKTLVEITDKEKAKQILSFIEKFEELDDVQRVSANFDISENLLKEIQGS
ncbi:MAG: YebC/PmpR family DNA-binding transcriptional regulator [bacterium]|nr:YebC/PmpR family DNA-binding transcriptional regulator [bacterium]